MKYLLLPLLILLFLADKLNAQQIPIYRHFYLNPSILNPAFNGSKGYNELNLYYRQQWVGIEDAPKIVGLNFQLPTRKNLFFGLDIYSEEVVFQRTSVGVLTMGYALPLSKDHEIRFALSGGGGLNSFNLTEDELNTTDPLVFQANQNSYYLDARFGIVYKYKRLNLGFSLPRLLQTKSITDSNISDVEFSEVSYKVFYGSYDIHLSPTVFVKPTVSYSTVTGIEEVAGAIGLSYKDIVWVGGSYQNTFGAFFGININNIHIQYNYEVSSIPGSVFDNASHGIQLSFKLGKNKSIKDKVVKGSAIAEQPKPEITKEIEPIIKKEQELSQSEQNKPKEEETIEKEMVPISISDTTKNSESQMKIEIKKEFIVNRETLDKGLMKRRGGLSMSKGFYVVTGVYKILDNAIKYGKEIMDYGYSTDMFINPKNNYYYVFVYYDGSMKENAQEVRDVLRKKKPFKDSWLMEVK